MNNTDHRIPIKRNILLILGLQGQGKTSLARMIHRRLTRSVVIDDHNEFEHGVRIEAIDDLVDYLTRNADKPFRVLYSSPGISHEPAADGSEFNRLVDFLFHIPDFTLFLNEVGMYTTPGVMPKALGRLIAQGRREFIDIVATVRRKAETHNLLTSQANMLASFKQLLPEDVNYMRSFVGDEAAAAIPNLAEHEFVYTTGAEFGRDKLDFADPEKINFLKKICLNGS